MSAAGMTPSKPSTTMLLLAFATVYLVWGSTYLAIRLAVESFPPFLMAGWRFLLAGLLLFAITRKRHPGSLTGLQWRNAWVVGTLLLLGGNGLVCWAEIHVPSGIAALIIATAPLWFVLLDWLVFRGPRPTLLLTLGIVLGLVGVGALLNPAAFRDKPVHTYGALALLLACLLWAGGSLWSKRIDLPKSPFVTTAMEMIGGGLSLLMVGTLLNEWPQFKPFQAKPQAVISFIYLFVVGSMVGLTAYVWLLQNCSPSLVSTYAFVNPVIAVLLGTWFGEPLGARTVAAMAIIVLGVMVITMAPKKRPHSPARREPTREPDLQPQVATDP